MRDLRSFDNALLDRAVAAAKSPTYRFHGRKPPKAKGERTPILDQAVSYTAKDGVAKMRLYGAIDSWGGMWGVSATEFVEALDEVGDVDEIRLHINSPGGEVWEALAILNQLRQHDAKVIAVVDGIAASCASFLAVAADETIMSKNSQLMIHDAWGLCVGNAAEMHDTGDILDKVSNNIASIYAEKTGDKTETWRATMIDEQWYDAQEAVDAGLADSLAGDSSDGESDPADAFDLKGIGMKFAGRAEAPAPAARTTEEPPAPPARNEREDRMRARQHQLNARRISA